MLETRFANYGGFLEITTNEKEFIIFKDSPESEKAVENLIEVIYDICRLNNKEFNYSIKEND